MPNVETTLSRTAETEPEFTPVVLIVFNDSRDVNMKPGTKKMQCL